LGSRPESAVQANSRQKSKNGLLSASCKQKSKNQRLPALNGIIRETSAYQERHKKTTKKNREPESTLKQVFFSQPPIRALLEWAQKNLSVFLA